MTRFTATDVDHAFRDWNATCGPAALAAILELTLDEVKPLFMPAFPGWTTPTRMFEALRRSGRKHSAATTSRARTTWPTWGLCRVQWEGPWTQPGANQRWAYTHTHWVAAWSAGPAICVFDVNSFEYEDDTGWLPLETWQAAIVPMLTGDIKRATGGWHITHSIEVQR